MFKINLISGFRFFILVLEYMRFLKSYRIQNNEVVKETVWTRLKPQGYR
jgi:hypothetical protein